MSDQQHRTPRSDRRFFAIMATLALLVVFAGFAPTFYLRATGLPPLSALVQVHGLVFTAWMLLFATQVTLVNTGRTAVHRRLGAAGAVLAPLMVVLGFITAVTGAKAGHTPDPQIPPLMFLAISVFNILAFGLLVAAALLVRRDPPAHKRLMLIATFAMLELALARLPVLAPYGPPGFFGVTDALLLACIARDALTAGKVHRAWLSGGAILVISQAGALVAAPTAPWLAFARWLTA